MFFYNPSITLATDAQLSFTLADKNNPARFSLVISHAEQIAGLKVVIVYDPSTVKFEKAEKSTVTSSFMHVVNDKTPGKVVVVMASAKGISGTNVALLHFEFTKNTDIPSKGQTITVSQIQLMDESLQEITTNSPIYSF